jgi:hypothetical protein
MSSSLAIVNAIVPQISLPPKYVWSCNTIPFVLNDFPTSLTGTGLVSKTALDYFPVESYRTVNERIKITDELIASYYFQK